jgi:hypothetical protein
MVWEGSAIEYWHRVIATGTAAVRAGSLRGGMRDTDSQPLVAWGRWPCMPALHQRYRSHTREQEA